MQKSLYTYNSHGINDGTNYEAWIPEDQPLQPAVQPIGVERSNEWPVMSGKKLGLSTLTIQVKCLGTIHSQTETLKGYFDVSDSTPHKLIIKDTASSNKQWYVYAVPISMPDIEGEVITIILGVADPVWRIETANSSTWSITASGDTKSITVGGNVYARPIFEITPTTIKGGGYAYKRFITLYNRTSNQYNNYPVCVVDDGTGDGVLDSATLIAASKMQTACEDLRVMVDGVEVNRWIASANTSQTKVWANIGLQPNIELKLLTAIADTGTPVTIDIKATTGYKALLSRLPSMGTVLIDSELFSYTGKDETLRQLSGITRAIKATSIAEHLAAATIRWIEHDIWLVYGNGDLDAPDTDDTTEPVLNLTNSNNISWDYDNFADAAGMRAGGWKPTLIKSYGPESEIYGGDLGTYADPAAAMGMRIKSYSRSGRYQAESAIMEWSIYQPSGITSVDANGKSYRYSTNWPSYAKSHKSKDGTTWYLITQYTKPTTAGTWMPWTDSSKSLSGYYTYVKWRMNGSVSASSGNEVALEVNDMTLSLSTTYTPYAKIASEEANYYLDARITNQTTGDFIDLQTPMALNDTMTVDTDTYSITHDDGTNGLGARTLSSRRNEWLKLIPGANVLAWDDTGTAAVTCVIKWQDRNN